MIISLRARRRVLPALVPRAARRRSGRGPSSLHPIRPAAQRIAAGIRAYLRLTRSSSEGQRGDIQGLRAVAVLLVVFDHAGVSFLKGGYVGVDVFFVLSGFLITGLLISGAGRDGYRSLATFYARRARRILPAAALTLVATDVVALSLLNFVRAKQVLQDSIPASLFAANFHFASQGTNYFFQSQPPSPIQHFWSLAVEEQFYLAWPVILLLVLLGFSLHSRRRTTSRLNGRPTSAKPTVTTGGLRRLDAVIVLIVAASLTWSVYYTHTHATSSYFSTFTRAWELGVGAALAIGAERLSRMPALLRASLGWIGLVAIAIAAVKFSAATPFPGYAALLPTVGAVLVIAAGLGTRHSPIAAGRVLSIPPMRYVGDRSYAFYLWHWPALIIAMQYEGHALPLLTNLLLVGGAFLLSIVSYALFENPIRRFPWASANRALVLWPASVLAVLIVAGWGIGSVDQTATRLASAGAPTYPGFGAYTAATTRPPASPGQQQLAPAANGGALPAVIATVDDAKHGARVPIALNPSVPGLNADYFNTPAYCSPQLDQSRSRICSYGTGSRTLLVFGDSHAQMWMPAIEHMAAEDGWTIRAIWKSGCSPAYWWRTAPSPPPACLSWFPWAVQLARSNHADAVLLPLNSGDLAANLAATRTGLESLVKALAPKAHHVVIVGDDFPQIKQPVDCLLKTGATLSACSVSPSPAGQAIRTTFSAVASASGAKYIDTEGWFCYQNVCPMVVGHTIVARDNAGHISGSYASELGQVFRLAFRRAIGLAAPAAQTPSSASAPSASTTTASALATPAAVTAAVLAARRGAPIPGALMPSVGSLLSDNYAYPPGCGAEPGQSSVKVCDLGDPTARRSLVIMGDSHAQMWMPAILAMARQDGWSVRPVGKSACTPADWWHADAAPPDCRAWYSWAIREIRSLRPTVAILAGSFQGLSGNNAAATTGIRSLVSALRPYVKHVLVLADQPPQTRQPVDCLLGGGATMSRCSFSPTPAQIDLTDTMSAATQSGGGDFVPTSQWFCADDICPMVVGHTIVYVDPGHITPAYADALAGPFRAAVLQAIGTGGSR